MRRLLGIDLAITAENRACLTDEGGGVLSERRFHLRRAELEELWERATDGLEAGDELVVVMEPTANAWVAPAAFFSSRGARVHLVPPEQSADLRRYYAKHVKNDRIDAKLLARVPLLHPEGLHEAQVPSGPSGTLRRLVARRARLAHECSRHRQRIRSLLQLAAPQMSVALGEELGKGALSVLERYGDPRKLVRLGPSRLAERLIKATRGAWRRERAEQMIAAAREAIELWEGLEGCDFEEIAEDLAAECRLIARIEAELRELDTRAAGLLAEIDPEGLFVSMPGFAERTATTVAGRLGDHTRFRNAAAIRSFIGMIPGTDQSGETESHPHLTKAGDPILRQGLFMAAEAARRLDPQLAEIYHRQMVLKGNHHTKAVCAVATALSTRLGAVLREQRPYELRDVNGDPVDPATARRIIAERYTVPAEIRVAKRSVRTAQRMKGRPVDRDRSRTRRPSPRSDETPTHDATDTAITG
jgi:transposase